MKIAKNIYKKIEKLENKYPYIDIEKTKEEVNSTIQLCENFLGYSIKNRISFSEYDYRNMKDPERTVFEKLTTQELRKMAYEIMDNDHE